MLSLLHQIVGRPWAIQAELAGHVHGIVMREGIGGLRHLAELKRDVHAYDDRAARARRRDKDGGDAVAVVSIQGTLTQRAEAISSIDSTRSTDDIAHEVMAAVAMREVGAVLLNVDSPGGEAFGLTEAFSSIRRAAQQKPVIASVNSIAASAALYLASAATEVWITPSGQIGSLGVYSLHVDASKAIEKAGESWEFIVADDSPHKVEGAPTGPLTESARADLQRMVNRYMALFVRDVAVGRGVSESHVRERFGRGRMLSPQEAVAVRMADRIGSFDEALGRAIVVARGSRERAADGEASRLNARMRLAEFYAKEHGVSELEAWRVVSAQADSRAEESERQRQVAIEKIRIL